MAGNTIQPGYGTLGVNDQLVPVFTASGTIMVPPTVGPSYKGYGQRPPATIPSGVTAGGGGSALAANAAGSAPFDFKLSPVPLLIIALVIGVLGLRYIHWHH